MKRFLSHALTNFLFLFLALYGGIFSISITFSLTEQLGFLFALVLCSAAGCALICSLPKKAARRGLALFAVLTLLFLLWYRFDQVFIGAQAVFHKISYLYHQIVPAIPYYVFPKNLTLSAVSGEINWFFGLIVPFFTLLMGYFSCSPQWSIWPVLLVSAALPAVGLVVLLEPPLLPALALVLFLGLWLLAGPVFRSDPDLGIRRTWIALVPLGLVLALLVAIVPPSRYVRSPRADALRADIMDRVGNWGLSLRTVGTSSAAIQDFANAGPLEFDGHTVLTVEGAAQGTLLLRGFSAGIYGESSWRGLSPEAYATLSVPPEADFPFTLPTRGVDNAEAVTAVVRLVTPSSAFLYTPYQLAALPSSVTGTSFYQDSYISRASAVRGWRVSYYPDLLPQTVSLTASSAQWEIAYRGWVYQNYTTVPARVSQDALRPPQLQGLSAPTTASGRIDAARRVTNYLAQTVRYDQQTPVTPRGEDFVTYFLTQSRQGYCLHYASAATLMLRAMGIPTRFVSGYMAYVPYDGAAVAIPDANAHAWVEIYLDGYGWYPVDVTAGFSGSTDTVFEPEASPSPSAVAASPTPSPSARPSATPTPAPSRSPSGSTPADSTVSHFAIPWRPILTGLASFAAVLALIWLQRKLRLLRWRRAMAHPDPNRAARSAYRYLSALARRGNIPIDPQAEALAQKAAFSQHTLIADEVQAMRDLTQATIKAARAHGSLPHRLMLRYFWALV